MAKGMNQPAKLTINRYDSVARRESTGAQHSGRGGAGNFFKGDDAEQAKHASNSSAIDEKPEGLAAKGKAFLLGKKDKDHQAQN